jgi:hypothetical protein
MFIDLKFQIIKQLFYIDMVYMKVIVINTIYNFIVEIYFIWSCLMSQNLILILYFKIYRRTIIF